MVRWLNQVPATKAPATNTNSKMKYAAFFMESTYRPIVMRRLSIPANRLRKNSDSRGFWEGHDFSRAVNSLIMCSRFSARGVLFAPSTTFSAACSAVPQDQPKCGLQPLGVAFSAPLSRHLLAKDGQGDRDRNHGKQQNIFHDTSQRA